MSRAGRNAHYEGQLDDYIPGATLKPHLDGFDVVVSCRDCSATRVGFKMRAKLPPDQIAKKMHNAGWTVGKKSSAHSCPDHYPKLKLVENTPMPDIVAPPCPPAPPAQPTAAEISEKARVARREAVLFLGDVFDPASGQFKGTETDKTVADATGLSVEAVSKLREEFYGPLKMPNELLVLQSDVKLALAKIDKLERDLKAEASTHCELMRSQIGSIGSRLNKVLVAKGW